MGYAFAMSFVERIGKLDRVLQHLHQRQRTFQQPLRKCLPFEIFHHQEINSVLMSYVVEDADVGMVQTCDRSCFAFESLAQFRTVSEMSRKNFDGDIAIEPRIAGFVHLSHSARTDRREDFVGPQTCAGDYRHGLPPIWRSQSITQPGCSRGELETNMEPSPVKSQYRKMTSPGFPVVF